MKKIEVSNIFTDDLPGDAEQRNFVRQVYEACYSEVRPKATSQPAWVHFNSSLAEELNLSEVDRRQLLPLLSGNADFEGAKPYAMCYGGHQFGNWAGQLFNEGGFSEPIHFFDSTVGYTFSLSRKS